MFIGPRSIAGRTHIYTKTHQCTFRSVLLEKLLLDTTTSTSKRTVITKKKERKTNQHYASKQEEYAPVHLYVWLFVSNSFFFARVRSLKQNESRCEHAARHSGVNSGLWLSRSCSLSFSCSPLPSLSPRTAYWWRTHTLTHSALRRLALLQRHVPSLFQIRCVCACVFLSAYLSILKCEVRVTSEKQREWWQEYICITYVCFPISTYVI